MSKLNIFLSFVALAIATISLGASLAKSLDYEYGEQGRSEYEDVDPKKPLDDQVSTVKIGTRTFRIPTAFVQSNLAGKEEQDGVNLLYVLPDFSSRMSFDSRQQYYKAKSENRFAHMLIQPGEVKSDLDQILGNLRRSVEKVDVLESAHGLEHELWYRRVSGEISPYYEYYIERGADGSVRSYINCSPDDHARFPGCSHIFLDNGIYYDIYYNKKNYLESWKEQKRRAIEFIDAFELVTEP